MPPDAIWPYPRGEGFEKWHALHRGYAPCNCKVINGLFGDGHPIALVVFHSFLCLCTSELIETVIFQVWRTC